MVMWAKLQCELEPADQPSINRLVVGTESLKIEHFEPVGDVKVDTPSGRTVLHHAATAEVRAASGQAFYLFGEHQGHLVGARTS
ncbi:MAG: hypothetical protein ACYCTI_07850 [Acidimicrobiales bacterium]